MKPTVTLMNRVSRTVTRVFRIGQGGTSGQRDRVNKASLIQDTSPPNVSFLWKTHKVYRDIPPTRPVCDATSGPISRTSNLLSTVLKPLLDQRDFKEGCDSTEDMLASVVKANEALDQNPAAKETITIWSMDAEALFPSLALKDILGGIWTLVTESSLEFKDVDVNEMAKFLAIEYTREELVRRKVISCIPKRQVESDGTSRGPPTLAYLD